MVNPDATVMLYIIVIGDAISNVTFVAEVAGGLTIVLVGLLKVNVGVARMVTGRLKIATATVDDPTDPIA